MRLVINLVMVAWAITIVLMLLMLCLACCEIYYVPIYDGFAYSGMALLSLHLAWGIIASVLSRRRERRIDRFHERREKRHVKRQ